MSLMPTQAAPVARRDAAGSTASADQSFFIGNFLPPFETDGADQSFFIGNFLPPFESDGADQSFIPFGGILGLVVFEG